MHALVGLTGCVRVEELLNIVDQRVDVCVRACVSAWVHRCILTCVCVCALERVCAMHTVHACLRTHACTRAPSQVVELLEVSDAGIHGAPVHVAAHAPAGARQHGS